MDAARRALTLFASSLAARSARAGQLLYGEQQRAIADALGRAYYTPREQPRSEQSAGSVSLRVGYHLYASHSLFHKRTHTYVGGGV